MLLDQPVRCLQINNFSNRSPLSCTAAFAIRLRSTAVRRLGAVLVPFRAVFLRLDYCIDGRRPADTALQWHIVCRGELTLVAFMPVLAALIAFFPGSSLRFGLAGDVRSWAGPKSSAG